MQWIDSHVHIGDDSSGISASYEDVRTLIDDGLINRAVVFCLNEIDGIEQGNKRIQDVVRSESDMEGLFRVDPALHSPEDLYERDDFAGFKMHPRSQDFSMHKVHQHLEVIGETRKPVLIHTGAWSKRAHPEEIIEAAEIHSDTTMLAAHNTKGYFYHTDEQWRQRFADADNLYMEISLDCTVPGLVGIVETLGSERVVFATDFPFARPEPMKKVVELASLTDEETADIAYRNAERLFF